MVYQVSKLDRSWNASLMYLPKEHSSLTLLTLSKFKNRRSFPIILFEIRLDRGCPNGTNTPRRDNFSRYQNLHCDLDL